MATRAYCIWDKRADFEIYTGILKDVERWAPRDSGKLRFSSNYQIGNTFIFKERSIRIVLPTKPL